MRHAAVCIPQEEEARERQEQVAAGRLLPLAGAVDDLGSGFGAGGGKLKRYVDEDELDVSNYGVRVNARTACMVSGKHGNAGRGGEGARGTAWGRGEGRHRARVLMYLAKQKSINHWCKCATGVGGTWTWTSWTCGGPAGAGAPRQDRGEGRTR